MRRYPFLCTAFILVTLLGVINFIAVSFYLYWTLWWIDIVMHFLGGFSLGFISLYVFYESDLFGNRVPFSQAIFISLIFVMILSGVWEVFEYVIGLTRSTEKYSLDVMHDLFSDALGAILASLLAKRFLKFS